MKLSKHIRYLVRVRDYETVQVEVGAEVDHHDLGYDDRAWAELNSEHRKTFTDHMELLLITEVEELALEELSKVAEWSDLPNNLAEDFLHSAPLPRSNNARTTTKKAGTSSPSRRVQRGPSTTPPAA
jgi:hypothetical protein